MKNGRMTQCRSTHGLLTRLRPPVIAAHTKAPELHMQQQCVWGQPRLQSATSLTR